MASLFVSYSRKDKDFAQRLTEELKTIELDFWIDWQEIEPTVDWWRAIETGIEESDTFLFLISPDSIASKVCARELEHAIQNGKRLIPLVVREIPGADAPASISHLNWIFFRESDNFDAAFAKLKTAIQTDYAWVQYQRKLQVKALEWERSKHNSSLLLSGDPLHEAEIQLEANANKQPPPTQFQREYVQASRKATVRRRRLVMGLSLAAAVIMTILAIYGLVQANLATRNAATAEAASTLAVANQRDAEAASTLAVNNQRDAEAASTLAIANQGTAQAASTVAVANEQQALLQARIAQAGQLAIPARVFQSNNFPLSLLLSIEAFRQADTLQSYNMLMDNTLAYTGLAGAFGSRHLELVKSLAIDPGENQVVSYDFGERITWDLETRQETSRASVESYAESVVYADGREIVASPHGQAIRLLQDGQPMGAIPLPEGEGVTVMALSPDGLFLAHCNWDGLVRIWDLAAGSMKTSLQIDPGLHDALSGLALSPGGRYLAYSQTNGDLVIWDADTGEFYGTVASYLQSTGYPSLAFNAAGTLIATGGYDGQITIVDFERMEALYSLSAPSGVIEALAFSPDDRSLVSGGVDGSLLLWDISNEQPKGYPVGRPLVSSSEGSGDAAISPELDWTVLEADGRLTLWDLRSGLPAAAPLSGGPDATINDLVFGPNGRQVAAAYDGMLFVWNVSDQNVAAVLEGSSAGDTALAFNPDGTILAAGSGDGSISLWDLQEQVLLDEPLPGMGDSIVDLTFSPKGDLLAAATYEGTVQIWDVARRAPLGDPIQLFSAFSLAFNAEQSLLAIGTGDGAVVLVDVQKREQIGEPLSGGAYYAIHSLTFSPNGQTLVFSDESGIINFWNVESRTRSFSLGLGFSGLAHDLVFSADGLGLYSVDNFGDVLYWNLDPETWITHACERAGRNLSAEEWSNYLPFNPEYHKTCSQWP